MNGQSNTSSENPRRTCKKSLSNLQIYYDKSLGKGSFSRVFPGRYKGQLVAVKIISTTHLEDKIVKQLQRELEVIRLLQKNPHPNIVTYHKIIYDEDKMIIVMELCSGGELSKTIKRTMNIESIKKYFSQILNGYKHLLELNIVHRDIKSANLLLTKDKDTVKFIDFGLSKIFSVDLNKTICGSPLYMAPELLNHEKYNSKSDIWSLGVLLYEMMYGHTPFHHCKGVMILKKEVQENQIKYPRTSTNISEPVPKSMIKYIKRLLEPDPSQRINWDDISRVSWLDTESDLDDSEDDNKYVEQTTSKLSTSESKYTRTRTNKKMGESSIFVIETDECDKSYTDHSVFESLHRSHEVDNSFFGGKHDMDDSHYGYDSRYDGRYSSRYDGSYNGRYDDDNGDLSDITLMGENKSLKTRVPVRQKKCSNPIPIKFERQTRYINSLETIPNLPRVRGESFGNLSYVPVKKTSDDVEDLSIIEAKEYFNDEYDKILERQRVKASDSGLVDINDVDDMLIAKIPEQTTAFEYINQSSMHVGAYIYSQSAPVASSVMYGIGNVAKKTIGTLNKIISPK